LDNRQFAELIAELSGKTSVDVLAELIEKFTADHVFDVSDEVETVEPIEPIVAALTEPTLPVYDEREDSGTEPLARHEVKLTPKGKKIADQIISLYPDPVLILGPAGMGKSLLCRYIAKQLGINYTALNCSEGLREEHLVGAQYPRTDENGNIVLEWRDGGLTKAARDGGLFLFEEITRARKEISARLFGLLDTDGRYWPLQEHPDVVGIPVHKNFWFIATGNPPAAGYHTTTLDTALQDRFQAIYTIKEPLAPEKDILTEICGAAVAEGLGRRPRRKRKRITKAELEAKGWCNCYVCLPKRGYEVDTRNGRRIS
jgi:midasin (ATPase involved in ribosome maturation)